METDRTAKDLDDVLETWESLAHSDPLWAILSDPNKKGNAWKHPEFFRTGVAQIDQLMRTLRHHDISFDAETVLDFGCGVGRLSQALLPYFASVFGVDVAPTMIRIARELNKEPARCHYVLNQEDNLKLFHDGQFTFIYSIIVLQHLPPDMASKYLAEFVRVLRPNGLLVFQLPSRFVEENAGRDPAFSAGITCQEAGPVVSANETLNLEVEVENSSPVSWYHHEPFPVLLGNHWLSPDGAMRVKDDGRTRLPARLLPGQKVTVSLQAKAPDAPGVYLLELDLVQEGVTWFKDKGSKTCLIEVKVRKPLASDGEGITSAAAPAQPERASPQPDSLPNHTERHFEMHCTPRPQILALLAGLGCRLEFIEPSGLGGAGTLSYVYFVRKP